MIRIGIVGLHNHYHAYPFAKELAAGLPGLELVGVADERADLAESFAEEYGCTWTTDYAELIARADHVELAADAGKPVLLDKPIATTMADADRIVAASRRVPVMLAYLLRFLPAYLAIHEAVKAGAVGDLVSGIYSIRFPVGAIVDRPGATEQGWYTDPIKGGGGGFLDHGVHFTDFFRWFFESDAVSVTAVTGALTYKNLGVEDYGIATYTLASGAIVTVESTWHAPAYFGPLNSPDHASLSGTKGEIELHYQKSPQTELQGTEEPWTGRRYLDFTGDDRYEACYRNILLAWEDSIRTSTAPVPDAEDGRKALEMILGAYEADRTGRRVTFPLVDDEATR